MKRSGLADSPFFRPVSSPPASAEATGEDSTQNAPQSVQVYADAQMHERTTAQLHERADEQVRKRTIEPLNKHTDAQLHNRSDERMHERTTVQPKRARSRESYDIYEDQAETIKDLQLRWSRERKKHMTIGEVMRELLDEILPTKRS